jgi:hypothetical protein
MDRPTDPTPSAADLRAALARSRFYRHQVAAKLQMHPDALGLYLNERRPLRPDLASRIAQTIDRLVDEADRSAEADGP